jgi:hypothetical protein
MTYIKTTLIESNYLASESDHYIGVDSKKPVTIVLPPNAADGKVIIVKAEMKPPLGNRKITIATRDGSLIDGYLGYTINVSNEFVHLVYRGNGWYTI